MKAKILSGLVILALALAIPYSAQASTRAIADTYTLDGLTYYNVNSPNFDSDKRFYVDAISAKHSVLGGHSLGDLWLMLAVRLGKGEQFDPFYERGFEVDYIDIAKQGILNGKIPEDNLYQINYSHGITMADMWRQARNSTALTC